MSANEDKIDFEKDLKSVITTMADSFDSELYDKTEAQLEEYWYFKWDAAKTKEWNLYQFHDLLDLYSSFCRRWEEHHHGSICVVERVRDKYMMPKIKAFVVSIGE